MSNSSRCVVHGSKLTDFRSLAAIDEATVSRAEIPAELERHFPNTGLVSSCSDCIRMQQEWYRQDQAYHATSYVADDDGVKITIRLGRKNKELDGFLQNRGVNSWSFITAWNPRSRPFSDSENRLRQNELIALLQVRDYTFFRGYGLPDEPEWGSEDSLFILNIDRTGAISFAKLFDQNAILWGRPEHDAELIWCL